MTLFSISILTTGLFYIASAISPFFSGNAESKRRRTYMYALLGFTEHTFAMLIQYLQNFESPVATSYGLVLSIAWVISAIQIAIPLFIKDGFFTMLPVAVLTLLPQACPMFTQAMEGSAKTVPSFALIHGLLAALSYGFLAISAIFGFVYLKQKSSLLKKLHSIKEAKMPSLEMLEKGISVFAITSTATMFASITAGIIATNTLPHTPALLLKFTFGGIIFAGQLALCISALTGYLRGAKLAKFSIILFVLAIIMLIPIELRTVI